MIYAGYDIGGTKCAVSLGSVEGDKIEIIAKEQFPTRGTPDEVLSEFANTLKRMATARGIALTDIAAAGISCGSPLDATKGIIQSPPNLPGWDDVHATEAFERLTGISTRLANDANACAVAEWKFGAGRGVNSMIFLTFGTGFGAGMILDGRLYGGASGGAGEIGHVRLAEDGPMGYGKRGSAEGFCSGGGVGRLAQAAVEAALAKGETPALLERAGGDIAVITAKLVAELAYEGDEFSKEIYRNCARKLGMAIAMLIDIVNPERIVIGGVFMRSESLIRPEMERVIREEALGYTASACEIVPAGLGESVGDYAAISVACM